MSFNESTKDIRARFRKAIIECGYNPIFIDEKEHNNQIVPEILYEIQKSKFVVVDVSEPNYGAYYEAGYALGLNKQVIICCDKNILQGEAAKSRPHFDIAQKSMVVWKDHDDLEKRLINRIKSTIN